MLVLFPVFVVTSQESLIAVHKRYCNTTRHTRNIPGTEISSCNSLDGLRHQIPQITMFKGFSVPLQQAGLTDAACCSPTLLSYSMAEYLLTGSLLTSSPAPFSHWCQSHSAELPREAHTLPITFYGFCGGSFHFPTHTEPAMFLSW